jgi:hypothetical protein
MSLWSWTKSLFFKELPPPPKYAAESGDYVHQGLESHVKPDDDSDEYDGLESHVQPDNPDLAPLSEHERHIVNGVRWIESELQKLGPNGGFVIILSRDHEGYKEGEYGASNPDWGRLPDGTRGWDHASTAFLEEKSWQDLCGTCGNARRNGRVFGHGR